MEKKIIVRTKQNEQVMGTLKAFDSHINIWMDDATISGETEIKIGSVAHRTIVDALEELDKNEELELQHLSLLDKFEIGED